jgi:hypothetical protein
MSVGHYNRFDSTRALTTCGLSPTRVSNPMLLSILLNVIAIVGGVNLRDDILGLPPVRENSSLVFIINLSAP